MQSELLKDNKGVQRPNLICFQSILWKYSEGTSLFSQTRFFFFFTEQETIKSLIY